VRYQYGKCVPYGFERVLSTYWDWEHFPVIHPRTLGEARVLTCYGNSIQFEQRWPRYAGVRLRSTLEAEFIPPDVVTIRILRGLFRGTFVRTVFSEVEGGTFVDETYDIPMPAWRWLEALTAKWLDKMVKRVWDEDLKVGLCYGGWPGVPHDRR
jgi:hypothetical protein